jgi:hypothetical protein
LGGLRWVLLDLTGRRFGRLVVTARAAPSGGLDRHARWLCVCDCGVLKIVSSASLSRGFTRNCGCLAPRRPGVRRSPLYPSYRSMLNRCYNPNNPSWANYGGRGIVCCERWRVSFEDFCADMGERPAGMTLERKNNDGPYTPDNCVWATVGQQARNKRTNVWLDVGGERMAQADAARRYGLQHHYYIYVSRAGCRLTRRCRNLCFAGGLMKRDAPGRYALPLSIG